MLRLTLILSALLLLTGVTAGAAQPDAYLSDARTAKALAFSFPRGYLSDCVALVSKGTGVSLSVAPPLGDEPLVAYVPRRPLRETMRALEELFDAQWTAGAGPVPAYVLRPEPVKTKKNQAARAQLTKQLMKGLDDQSAQAVQDARKEIASPDNLVGSHLALLLWAHLKPAERAKVLRGERVSLSIPEGSSRLVYEAGLSAARRAPNLSMLEMKPLAGPILATFDLDDWRQNPTENAIPNLRARLTALRADSCVGGIGTVEFVRVPPAPKVAIPPDGRGAAAAPAPTIDRVSGSRDEVVFKIAQVYGVPVLSRHRSSSQPINLEVAGGSLARVMADFALGTESRTQVNARGFQLVRSLTEHTDPIGYPTRSVVEKYLANRPKEGETVHLDQLAELAVLSPIQLGILQRMNRCSSEASFLREAYAVARFYRALSPEQRKEVFSREGIAARSLTHPQLHALLDHKLRRADWEVHEHLQQLSDLRFRFVETKSRGEYSLAMHALRNGRALSSKSLDLPQVEPEDQAALIP